MNSKIIQYILSAVIILLTVFFSEKIDFAATNYFFSEETKSFSTHPLFQAFYDYGTKPGLALGIGGALVFVGSFFMARFRPFRQEALFLALVLALGSGLLINGIIKPYWGRPRPRATELFGGQETYRPFYYPGGEGKSFCSGHSSMGFYFYALYRLGKRRHSSFLKGAGLFLILFLGGGLSLARVAAGGHIFSDVLASFFIMAAITLPLEKKLLDIKPV